MMVSNIAEIRAELAEVQARIEAEEQARLRAERERVDAAWAARVDRSIYGIVPQDPFCPDVASIDPGSSAIAFTGSGWARSLVMMRSRF